MASHTVYLVRTFINMAKAELYPNTQEYMGWKELQKNYGTSAQTKGETSKQQQLRGDI